MVAESDDSVLDVVLDVELAQSLGLDADVEVLFQLEATLLKAHEAPSLEHLLVQQVSTDPRHDLQASIVPPVEAPSVDELAL